MNIHDETLKMKLASPLLSASSLETRNKALALIRESLNAHKEEIFEANRKDLALAEETGVPAPVKKRLKFDEAKLSDVTEELTGLMALPDPLRNITLARELDQGLTLYRVTCPIGVIGVIFEARPDALVQISSLCLKSGNCAILKGGKETTWTNRVLFSLIHQAAIDAGLPENCLLQAEQHNEIDELLECHDTVDLLIPRGSNAFVQYIMNHTNIPVLGHADGVCHIYVDKEYDKETAIPLIVDAKTQYPAACNAVETVLIHRDVAKDFLPGLAKALRDAGVKLRGTEEVNEITPVEIIPESESFHHEYVDLIIALKIVGGVDEAINHINTYGSHHTDCILTQNAETAEKFMTLVDSANVYQNASTRFADGFRYGFGAEVGISTSKIHARGPVGLEGLLSYKYKLFGHGDIVGDYASGKKHFIHKDL
ncbi:MULTISPECIES: glutamate-5-semialdehyde dehydrogenase [Dialister]|jgi:glutamate-5-semialdehyde dehydrogenase|uniref:Gamma-glutamyl phosphate reductase n=1 Tax=Dialister hominis TaxID=2582419 RepID=A0A8D5A389_9FIRM|nr:MULTISPECIES: glutamate-5-semialdehyde dehydrogenase [Dialister]MBS6413286.1 glutamate-5-semialdehyde dehydrogenase [Dialister sp.]BBK26153.1 gamma-glutamyl phosphate reductase [Dialister hominis]